MSVSPSTPASTVRETPSNELNDVASVPHAAADATISEHADSSIYAGQAHYSSPSTSPSSAAAIGSTQGLLSSDASSSALPAQSESPYNVQPDASHPQQSNVTGARYQSNSEFINSQRHRPRSVPHSLHPSSQAFRAPLPPSSTPPVDNPDVPQRRRPLNPAPTEYSYSEFTDLAPPTSIVSLDHGYGLEQHQLNAEMTALRFGYILPQSNAHPEPWRANDTRHHSGADPPAPLSTDKHTTNATYGHNRSDTTRSFGAPDASPNGNRKDFGGSLGLFDGLVAFPQPSAAHSSSPGASSFAPTTSDVIQSLSQWDLNTSYTPDYFSPDSNPALSNQRKRSYDNNDDDDNDSFHNDLMLMTNTNNKRRSPSPASRIQHNSVNCPNIAECVHMQEMIRRCGWSDTLLPSAFITEPTGSVPVSDLLCNFCPYIIINITQDHAIRRTMTDAVHSWIPSKPQRLKLYLHQFDCPLEVDVYEFNPTDNVFNGRTELYVKDQYSDAYVMHSQYAPPLGMKAIQPSDRAMIDRWIDKILTPKYGFMMLESFNEADDPMATHMMTSLYKVYLDTKDTRLRTILEKCLRVIPLSFAKTHVLMVDRSDIRSILEKLRDPGRPPLEDVSTLMYMGPKMANRQLKVLITAMMQEYISWHLAWIQNTLVECTTPLTTSTWFCALCIVITLAVVGEKMGALAHTAWVHQPKVQVGTKFPEDHAKSHYIQDIERMNKTFDSINDLFHNSFRNGTWSKTDFHVPGSPPLTDTPSRVFVLKLIDYVKKNRTYMEKKATEKFDWSAMFAYEDCFLSRLLVPFATKLAET